MVLFKVMAENVEVNFGSMGLAEKNAVDKQVGVGYFLPG